ncbi:MAG: 6-phosphogluconolactonase, partial [Acidimicrobiia bacterium]|nr:6-phosphogluconolactonase [Acidimicrobiia bacterium]
SGGSTPRLMLEHLAARDDIEWDRVTIFQVDERVAPEGHPDRNLVMLEDALTSKVAVAVQPMPVDADDLDLAAGGYAAALEMTAGSPPVLDLVQLGLGEDGHTASLAPDDPVLDFVDRDVALTRSYRGQVRMTLTRPVLDRARQRLWLVSGMAKADAFSRLLIGDISIPATLISTDRSLVLADRSAATGGNWS